MYNVYRCLLIKDSPLSSLSILSSLNLVSIKTVKRLVKKMKKKKKLVVHVEATLEVITPFKSRVIDQSQDQVDLCYFYI